MPIYILEPAGTHLNQYQIDSRGRIRAPDPALLKSTVSDADIAAITAQFDLLMQLDVGANAYFDAQLLVEPELVNGRKTYDLVDEDGVDTGSNKYYPAWIKYNAAQDVIEAAGDNVKALYTVRNGKPEIELDGEELVTNQGAIDAYDVALVAVQALNIPASLVDDLAVAKIAAKQSIIQFLKDHTLVMTATEADALTKNAIAGIATAEDTESLDAFMLGVKNQAYQMGSGLGLI